MNNRTAVALRDVTKSWGEQHVLRGVSLEVGHGEFVVLLGPSGCGKSTLLRLIAGLEVPDAGDIFIDGHDVASRSPSERKLSMVFQSYALFPHLNVSENVSFGLTVRRVPRAERERRVAEALATTGLTGLEARRPAQLSGGQRQRVALARAIVGGHSLCLMDEPLSNLDAKLRHSVRLELRALQRRLGITVIYVTHDQTEAMGMADRIVLMNAGRIEQCGSPESLYKTPRSTFVATFIGSPPMVLFPEASVPAGLRHDAAHSISSGTGVFGIRPEDLVITSPGEHAISGTVTALEFQGAESYVYVTTVRGEQVVVRNEQKASSPTLVEGQTIGLTWSPDAGHLFDSTTGQRLNRTLSSCQLLQPAPSRSLPDNHRVHP